MKVHVINGRALDAAIHQQWQQLQGANPSLGSPYFCVEFTEAVALTRTDVEVAVIEVGGNVVAFFPFQRNRWSVGKPVGGIISDYQGIICNPDFACDPTELLRACSLLAWDFDHLLVSQSFFARYHRHQEGSPILDLSNGYAAYATQTHAARVKLGKLQRRLERDVGSLRFVFHSDSTSDLAQVLAWKSAQYQASDVRDIFAATWVRKTVEQIHGIQSPKFSGVLSLLYAGDRLIAGHFGMRTSQIWHYWFPSYDPNYSRYSPGFTLLLKMAEAAPSLGIKTIDLGKGISSYKERLRNGYVMVADGSVEPSSLLKIGRQLKKHSRSALREFLLRTPLDEPARRLVNYFR
jgi:CelD/BcsL family acetyltransferase involved in cellulose biosynthesis